MRKLNYYDKLGLKNEVQVFEYFAKTITPSNQSFEYWNNWNKILKIFSEYEDDLNILDSLCGSKNFEEDLKELLTNNISIIRVFPMLLAIRDEIDRGSAAKKIMIMENKDLPDFKYKLYDFENEPKGEGYMDEIILFFQQSGLKKLITQMNLSSIKDFALGVELGLDSNGRKSRGGKAMEEIVDSLLKNVYKLNESEYIFQATSKKVKDYWGLDIPTDKTSRRMDYMVKKSNKLFWIETNFYNGPGSKLKSTAGEYKDLFDFCKSNDLIFIWITDGRGWYTSLNALQEAYNYTDYVFNLNMIKNGILNELWD